MTNRMLRELHPQRFCKSTIRRGSYRWTCYQQLGHDGPHWGGNADNDPVYRMWFDIIDGDADDSEDLT